MPTNASSTQVLPPHANISTSTTRRTLFQPTLSRRPASSTSTTSHTSSNTASRPTTAASRPVSRSTRTKQPQLSSNDKTDIVPRDNSGRYAVPALMTTTLPSPEGEEDILGLEEREKEEQARIDNARANLLNARWRGYGGWEGPEMDDVAAVVWEKLREGLRKADSEAWMFGMEEREGRGYGGWGSGDDG